MQLCALLLIPVRIDRMQGSLAGGFEAGDFRIRVSLLQKGKHTFCLILERHLHRQDTLLGGEIQKHPPLRIRPVGHSGDLAVMQFKDLFVSIAEQLVFQKECLSDHHRIRIIIEILYLL